MFAHHTVLKLLRSPLKCIRVAATRYHSRFVWHLLLIFLSKGQKLVAGDLALSDILGEQWSVVACLPLSGVEIVHMRGDVIPLAVMSSNYLTVYSRS